MQRTETLLPPHHAVALESGRSFAESLRVAARAFFGCRHKGMSRPFTQEGRTYRVCLKCGMRRAFDLRSWQTYGPFYLEGDPDAGRFGPD